MKVAKKLPDDQIKGLLCFGASRITITKNVRFGVSNYMR